MVPRIAIELHASWGHASAKQLQRALADSEGNSMHLLTCVDGVLERREVCQAFRKAPRAMVAGAPTAAAFDGKLRVGLLSLGDIIDLRVIDVFSK